MSAHKRSDMDVKALMLRAKEDVLKKTKKAEARKLKRQRKLAGTSTATHVHRPMSHHEVREHMAFFSKAVSELKSYYGKLGESLWQNRFKKPSSVIVDVKTPVDLKTGFRWADVEETDSDPKQSEFDRKVTILKGEMGRLVGDRPVSIRMTLPGTHNAATTTGVVNGVITVDASQFIDWSSISVMFDEYKITRGDVQWMTVDGSVTVPTVNSVYVWCYDPADSTALVSTNGGFLQEQHKLTAVTNTGGLGAVGTYHNGECHLFRFKVPNGIFLRGTTTVNGLWMPTVAPVPYGFVKTYFVGTVVTNVAVTTWYIAIDVTFRIRT